MKVFIHSHYFKERFHTKLCLRKLKSKRFHKNFLCYLYMF